MEWGQPLGIYSWKTTLLISCVFTFLEFFFNINNKLTITRDIFLVPLEPCLLVSASYFKSYIHSYILGFDVCNCTFIIVTKLSCLHNKNETKNLGCHASRFVGFIFQDLKMCACLWSLLFYAIILQNCNLEMAKQDLCPIRCLWGREVVKEPRSCEVEEWNGEVC